MFSKHKTWSYLDVVSIRITNSQAKGLTDGNFKSSSKLELLLHFNDYGVMFFNGDSIRTAFG